MENSHDWCWLLAGSWLGPRIECLSVPPCGLGSLPYEYCFRNKKVEATGLLKAQAQKSQTTTVCHSVLTNVVASPGAWGGEINVTFQWQSDMCIKVRCIWWPSVDTIYHGSQANAQDTCGKCKIFMLVSLPEPLLPVLLPVSFLNLFPTCSSFV